MNAPTRRKRHFAALPSILLIGAGFAAASSLRASPEINEKEGAKLLAAELHVGPADLDHASCNALSGALYRTVVTHRPQATSLLDAALAAKGREAKANGGKLACECASKLLRAALAADPKQASRAPRPAGMTRGVSAWASAPDFPARPASWAAAPRAVWPSRCRIPPPRRSRP